MSLTITDLFTPLTAAQIRAKMVVELLVLQVPADKWRAGGVASSILTVCSILFAMMNQVLYVIISGFFLPTATGTGLKALAFYVYGVTVSDATFATGVLTLTNTGGGVYPKVAGSYTAIEKRLEQIEREHARGASRLRGQLSAGEHPCEHYANARGERLQCCRLRGDRCAE